MSQFEFDPEKSQINKEKHGINFDEAQKLWDDPNLLEFKAKPIDEERFMVIGIIDLKHWSAVITYRDENIRIISARRSRDNEVRLYNES